MLTITSASILFVQHPALAYSWRKSYEGEQLQGARKQSGLSAGKTFLVQFIFPLLIAPFFSLAQTPVHREPSDLGVESLTCNTAVNPLGVDDALPRFHWSLKPRTELLRGERQTAFQILVASSRAQLDHDSGDLWDSTKKPGALTPQVFYAGEPLESDIVYFWKVAVSLHADGLSR
jgi:hypothetical protein